MAQKKQTSNQQGEINQSRQQYGTDINMKMSVVFNKNEPGNHFID